MTRDTSVPISRPTLGDEELSGLREVLNSGMLSQGEVVKRFEDEFAAYVGAKYCVATNSGTSGLHTVLAALGVGEGHEVMTTAFSFVATASCIVMREATPVFVDICPETYNIAPNQIESKITPRTKAIIVVHLYGQPCALDEIMSIAEAYRIPVIEDACQAHGAEYKQRKVGSIGRVGVFSFYPTKNMTTGEGGAITTDDQRLADLARTIRDHGQKRRYWHETLGYNYRMTDIAAAIGLAQLHKLDNMNAKRIENAAYYSSHLRNVIKPCVSDNMKHVFHQYTIRVEERQRFLAHLESNNIGYGIHYPYPLHRQPLFRICDSLSFPEAERASLQVVSLPVHPSLTSDQIERVASAVNRYGG